MTAHCAPLTPSHSYYVVMLNYPDLPRKQQAIVNPEDTRRQIVARIRSGEYQDIAWIHEIRNWLCSDVTEEILEESAEMETA